MDFNLVLGLLCIAFGVFTVYARIAMPEKLGKLEAMKQKWGPSRASAIHFFFYSLLPVILGLLLVFASSAP